MILVGLGPACFLGLVSTAYFLSHDFRSGECWLSENDGHWFTVGEAVILSIMMFGWLNLGVYLLLAVFLVRTGLSTTNFAITIGAIAVVITIITFLAHWLTNDAYIERLYLACGRRA